MRGNVVWQLIRKDWRLHRMMILITLIAGIAALAIVQWGGQTPIVVGGVFFFIALILGGHMLPFGGIVNERKNKNLAFLMSLPISSIQYTTSKLISNVLMFLIPWLALVAAAVILIMVRGMIPRGAIPVVLILSLLPFVGFCLITGAALVGESEGWSIAANVFCSSTYGLTWYSMTQIPSLMVNTQKSVPVWNAITLKILGAEILTILVMLGLTYFFQSRKRDFV
jgi:ABC-2 type transport system permease protein